MEKVIEEVPLVLSARQFWGAVKIYTEKPHVINRRICGTVDMWVGYTNDAIFRETLVGRLKDLLESDTKVGVNGDATCSGKEPGPKEPEINTNSCDLSHQHQYPISLVTKGGGCPFSNTENFDSQCTEAESVDDKIKKALYSEGFRELNHENIESRSSVHEENEHHKLREIQSSTHPSHERKWEVPWQYLLEAKVAVISLIRRIIPKQLDKFIPTYEVVIMESRRGSVMYLNQSSLTTPSLGPRIHYSFTKTNTGVALSWFTKEGETENNPSLAWVQQKVLPKVVKWATEVKEDSEVEDKGSLRLIRVQEYNQLYQKLKAKYGKQLVKMWPEKTDPLKYVYEDIAIATYLILLWQQEREEKDLVNYQSFVDLGCGNGLLVYILCGEGHTGLGIDIKKRGIWDQFSPQVHLKEDVIEPSDKNLFPEYDWLIGNHSDELTPWLPVIAAKSSYTTRFFVIPCCPHDFACKYRRRDAGKSQYSDYLEYVKEVGSVCGFEVWRDKLRIPSTKRICLIGQNRTYSKEDAQKTIEDIDVFVRERERANSIVSEQREGNNITVEDGHVEKIQTSDKDKGEYLEKKHCISGLWSSNFKARDSVQQVRNCTQLKKGLREELVSTIANMLMEKKHIIQVEVESDVWVEWDRGGSMTMADIARGMETQQLQALKKECGGLQTLLKNHRHMFSLQNGQVYLQSPVPAWRASVPSERIKTKCCWFHQHHRRGCPLPSHLCVFAHGDDELREAITP
ncbi:hypothetical protein Pcinc_032691 [Petrolisthes cinctipes]|uniref:tRNA (uracil-O(2)-)-methyltransferase n=1 Tax=Petrolisthes cinctipes TaxID=88211 RepID=A0AAE1ETS5_PETCI|nr:hypothetical protein Pcinc_032691 [Petrolisthes cinctipes]